MHFTSTSSYPADVGASAKCVVALHDQKQDRMSNVGGKADGGSEQFNRISVSRGIKTVSTGRGV